MPSTDWTYSLRSPELNGRVVLVLLPLFLCLVLYILLVGLFKETGRKTASSFLNYCDSLCVGFDDSLGNNFPFILFRRRCLKAEWCRVESLETSARTSSCTVSGWDSSSPPLLPSSGLLHFSFAVGAPCLEPILWDIFMAKLLKVGIFCSVHSN